MLRYKPSKHVPVRVRVPKGIDIRTTKVYNGRCKNSKPTDRYLTFVR